MNHTAIDGPSAIAYLVNHHGMTLSAATATLDTIRPIEWPEGNRYTITALDTAARQQGERTT